MKAREGRTNLIPILPGKHLVRLFRSLCLIGRMVRLWEGLMKRPLPLSRGIVEFNMSVTENEEACCR